MSENPPDWAVKRVCDLLNAGDGCGDWDDDDVLHIPASLTFAHYVAAHEEPPVDPLLIEARTIAADTLVEVEGIGTDMLNCIRIGIDDNNLYVKAALTALRRGIELGSVQS